MENNDIPKAVFRPKIALIVYENGVSYHLETRSILLNGKMGPAKNVTRKLLRDIAETAAGSKKETSFRPHGIIPSNLLYADPDKETYVWYEKAGIHNQTFVESLGLEDGQYPFPTTVFKLSGNHLYAFSCLKDKPTANTRLYKAPLFNYYQNGKVCLGNSKVNAPESMTWDAYFAAWQRLLWDSTNSHLIIENPVNGNLVTIMRQHKGLDRFDSSCLIATNKRIKDLFDDGNTKK